MKSFVLLFERQLADEVVCVIISRRSADKVVCVVIGKTVHR